MATTCPIVIANHLFQPTYALLNTHGYTGLEEQITHIHYLRLPFYLTLYYATSGSSC